MRCSDSNTLSQGSEVLTSAFTRWNSPSLPIIVVGAVNNRGIPSTFTQWNSDAAAPDATVDVWAPGEDIQCDKIGGGSKSDTGTSPGKEHFILPFFSGMQANSIDSLCLCGRIGCLFLRHAVPPNQT